MTPARQYPHTPDDLARFWSRVSKQEGCWLWTAGKFSNGYGAFRINGNNVRAHRFSFFLKQQMPIPNNTVVRHSCDTKACVNPQHLLIGSQQDNVDDRNSRGRQAKGESVPTAKLTDGQIESVRRDLRSQRKIATAFGVTRTAVQKIQQRKAWKHVA